MQAARPSLGSVTPSVGMATHDALISWRPGRGFQELRWGDLALRFGNHNLTYRRSRSLAISLPIRWCCYASAHTPLKAIYLHLLMIGCLNVYTWWADSEAPSTCRVRRERQHCQRAAEDTDCRNACHDGSPEDSRDLSDLMPAGPDEPCFLVRYFRYFPDVRWTRREGSRQRDNREVKQPSIDCSLRALRAIGFLKIVDSCAGLARV
jgi:hypothetical protein